MSQYVYIVRSIHHFYFFVDKFNMWNTDKEPMIDC